VISVHHAGGRVTGGELSGFRREFHACLTRRADALFELCDAVLCADGPVRSIANYRWWASIAVVTAADVPH
jgi:hypothetical protein